MRKAFLALGFVFFLLPLHAEEPQPSLPPPPTLNLSEIRRPLVEKLKTPEEDEAYFGGVEGRFEREQVVIIKRTKLSIEKSSEDRLIIYLLTVYDSTGECYGLCKEVEPVPEGEPRFHWHVIPIDPALIPATLTGGFFFIQKIPSRGFFITSSLLQCLLRMGVRVM